jgi:hypothetical protein
MRPLILLLALVGGCGTVEIELFPGDLALDGDLAPPSDGGADQSVAGAPPDLASPDLAPGCVCRFVSCRVDADCQATIGPGSTCDASFTCSGGGLRCTQASACAGDPSGWICAASANSTVSCGP